MTLLHRTVSTGEDRRAHESSVKLVVALVESHAARLYMIATEADTEYD